MGIISYLCPQEVRTSKISDFTFVFSDMRNTYEN